MPGRECMQYWHATGVCRVALRLVLILQTDWGKGEGEIERE